MKYTDEELELAQKVAEVMGPWEPKRGDWFIQKYDPCSEDDPAYGGYVETSIECFHPPLVYFGKLTWLPSIQDCLDWLDDRGSTVLYTNNTGCTIEFILHAGYGTWKSHGGNTKLEAAYRTVIEVGEAGKEGE